MVDLGMDPDFHSNNSAIVAYGEGDQWEKAVDLLQDMAEGGLQPKWVCYNRAIGACGKGGLWEKALDLLGEMVDRGIKPDTIANSTVIEVCFQNEQCAEALSVVRGTRIQNADHFPTFWKQQSLCWDLRKFPLALACTVLADSLVGLISLDKTRSPF